QNGGLIEMEELLRLVTKLRGVSGGEVTEDDVVRSIKTLQPMGVGYQVVSLADGRKMVRSAVKELDEDQAVVLASAQQEGGRIVEDILVTPKGWTRGRARAALENMLIRDGLSWLDEQDEECGKAYWVTSAMKWDV
ncbi:EAP30/Vps36 family-domain-containing protein, partial [Mycena sanguinolenta]